MPILSVSVQLEKPSLRREHEFLAAVRHSRALHGRWLAAPASRDQLRTYLRKVRGGKHFGHFVTSAGRLAGVININEVVRGGFQSGYLGYYALWPHAGSGCMHAGLTQVLRLAFREYGLHRLEANIQPENTRSIALVRGLGFRLEGFSPRYLKIAGRWRDHERWALTRDDKLAGTDR
jgi:ribosomal-protein-alanine N-acetyltransferase